MIKPLPTVKELLLKTEPEFANLIDQIRHIKLREQALKNIAIRFYKRLNPTDSLDYNEESRVDAYIDVYVDEEIERLKNKK